MQIISANDAYELSKKDDSIIIDVRETEEFTQQRPFGATSHPLSNFSGDDLLNVVADKKHIIFSCRSGGRSQAALSKFMEFLDDLQSEVSDDITLYNLSGGIMAWCDVDLPTETD